MKKIRIITNIDANHGSIIFNCSLNKILNETFPNSEVKFLNSIPIRLKLYEYLRLFKINSKIPFYNYQRYRTLLKYSNENIDVERLSGFATYNNLISKINERQYNALVIGKPVWNLNQYWHTPRFPNIFWLSEKLHAKKIAYAVSAHRTDNLIFEKHKSDICRILSSFSLIGVRDDLTHDIMTKSGVSQNVQVIRVSDPAFLFNTNNTDYQKVCDRFNVRTDIPTLGLLYYGKPELSEVVYKHYKQKGYQILNFNMFNQFADINLGHRVTPEEWAALFNILSFCITDRFHVSVFCILNDIPFVGIEPFKPMNLANSKVYNLLKDFDLHQSCYVDTYSNEFSTSGFLQHCIQIEKYWKTQKSSAVKIKLTTQIGMQKEFIEKIKGCF